MGIQPGHSQPYACTSPKLYRSSVRALSASTHTSKSAHMMSKAIPQHVSCVPEGPACTTSEPIASSRGRTPLNTSGVPMHIYVHACDEVVWGSSDAYVQRNAWTSTRLLASALHQSAPKRHNNTYPRNPDHDGQRAVLRLQTWHTGSRVSSHAAPTTNGSVTPLDKSRDPQPQTDRLCQTVLRTPDHDGQRAVLRALRSPAHRGIQVGDVVGSREALLRVGVGYLRLRCVCPSWQQQLQQ